MSALRVINASDTVYVPVAVQSARSRGVRLRARGPGGVVKMNAGAGHWQFGPLHSAPGRADRRPACCFPGPGDERQWRGTAAWGPSALASPSARAQAQFMTTYDDIAKLQAQIDDLQAQQVDLRKQLAKA